MSQGFIRTPFGGEPESTRVITSAEQFNNAVNGVVTVPDNQNIIISGTIDLQGNRIVCGRNVSISGHGTENNILKSTGLTDPLITSEWSVQLLNLTITAGHAYDLDATANANQNLDWFKVNFTDCATVGTIKNYDNCIMLLMGYLNSDNITYDGTIATIGYDDSIFTGTGSGTTLILPSSLTITRRFRATNSAFVSFTSQIAIDYQSPTVPIEGFLLNDINFSGGATYIQGIDHTSNFVIFTNCNGIVNSADIGHMSMQGNSTETPIAVQGTFYKVLGTTSAGSAIEKFTHTNNRLTYVGALSAEFKISVTLSATSGNNRVLAFRIAIDGVTSAQSESKSTSSGNGRSENISLLDAVSLTTGAYIELFCANTTNTDNITVEELNIIVTKL